MKYTLDRSVRRSVTIYTEDGGVSSIYHNGDSFITEYVKRRLKDMSQEQWDYIHEGKIYSKEWPHKSYIDDEMIKEALRWLATAHIEFMEVQQDNFQFQHTSSDVK